MKTIRLLILIFFTLSTLAHAADNQPLSNQTQQKIQQMTQEMSALGIPEAQAQKMLTRMHQNRFQQQNIVRAQQTVMDAAKESLPTEPIMNKAMEGMVKKVQEQQVIRAMETVRNRHQYAYRMAKSLSADEETTEKMANTITDCLTAGMSVQDMDRIAARLTIQTRQQTKNQAEGLSLQTMQTVRTMARLGAANTDVSDSICLALQHQYTSQQMKQLRHNFSIGAQQTSARQLAHQYASSIEKGETPGNSRGNAYRGGSDNDGGSGSSGSGGGSGGSGSGGGSGGSDSGGGSGGSGSGGGSGGSGSGGGSGGSGGGGGK